MKTLNKIILTSLIGLGSFGKVDGQDTNLDSLFDENIEEMNNLENSFDKYEEIIPPKYFSERVYSENLCINLNEKICYVTKKNEKEGIKDLIKICNGDYEESWLYLPEKQIWYEIGINSDSNSVKPFLPRIEKALEENKDVKELIFYHNHPSEGFDQPSINDILMLMHHNCIFQNYKIAGKIITKDEITEYSLNSKGKEKSSGGWWEYSYFSGRYDDLSEYLNIKCTPNKFAE